MSSGEGPIAVLADLHANVPALLAVCRDMRAHDAREVWCLGDLAGYGPHISALLAYVSQPAEPWTTVRGNHDAMLIAASDDLNSLETARARPPAKRAIGQQIEELGPASPALDLLRALPAIAWPRPDVLLIHPDDDAHGIYDGSDASDTSLAVAAEHHTLQQDCGDREPPRRLVVFRGHTHRPSCVVRDQPDGGWRNAGCTGEILLDGHDAWINPGSVGESRVAGDSRAFYGLYWPGESGDRLRFRRVEYDTSALRGALCKRYYVMPAWRA